MRRRCFFVGVCMWGDVRWREEVLWEKLFKICIDLVPIFSSMKVVGFWYKVCRLIDLILLFYLYSHKCRQHSFILFVSVDVQSSWLVGFFFSFSECMFIKTRLGKCEIIIFKFLELMLWNVFGFLFFFHPYEYYLRIEIKHSKFKIEFLVVTIRERVWVQSVV